jgi:hypothetical protein
MTANSLRPRSDEAPEARGCREPVAIHDALVYESYGSAEEQIRITEGASVNPAGGQHGRRTQVPKVTAIENQAATGLRR